MVLLIALAIAVGAKGAPGYAVVDPKVEYLREPLGVDIRQPRFSWTVVSTRATDFHRGATAPQAFRLRVSKQAPSLPVVWDSGRVESPVGAAGTLVRYNGSALLSDQDYKWTVTVFMSDGTEVPLRSPAGFGTGLFSPGDWRSTWITSSSPNATLYRKEFTLPAASAGVATQRTGRATLFVSGLGYNEVTLNGVRVGDHRLDPGWTDYAAKVYYSSYDVTVLLRPGAANALGVSLGVGWFFPPYLHEASNGQLLLQLQVDGKPVVTSDTSWKAAPGPIVYNSLYNGETYDARLEQAIAGWAEPGFDDGVGDAALAAWTAVVEAKTEVNNATLASQLFQPIRQVRALAARSVTSPAPGKQIFDFGQNTAAVLRIRLRAGQCAPGANVTIRHAEALVHPPFGAADGTLYTANLRGALATDVYICSGDGSAVEWSPSFTQHGFRYAEISGGVGPLAEDQVAAMELHTDVEQTSSVTFSAPLLNAIQHAVVWGQKSNLMGLPTDCPQRDERKGWMGDAALSAEEATFNFDMGALYSRWVEDMVDDQRPDGAVPDIVPAHGWWLRDGAPSYQTAFPTVTWTLTQYHGDRDGVVLRQHQNLVRYYENFLGILNKTGLKNFPSNYGDWEPPACKGSTDPTSCKISGPLVGAFSFMHDLSMGVQLFRASAHPDGPKWSARCAATLLELTPKFHTAFYNASIGLYGLGRQTEQALPLFLGLVPPELKPKVLAATIEDIVQTEARHTTSGILGIKFMLEALAQEGRGDVAVDMLMQNTFPSYGYMIKGGEHGFEPATTLWELWDSDTNGPNMNSRNHIMFGSVGSFFYKHLLGVTPLQPGYAQISVRPAVVTHPNLTHVSGTVATPLGRCVVAWSTNLSSEAALYQLDVAVPLGARGKVAVPLAVTAPTAGDARAAPLIKESGRPVWSGGRFVSGVPGVLGASIVDDQVMFSVASGNYHFTLDNATTTATAAAAVVGVVAANTMNATGKGLWVWGAYSPLTNQSASDAFFEWAAKETAQPVRTVFLEDEDLARGGQSTAVFERFLDTLAHSSSDGITAAPLFGWNGGEGPFPAANILAFVDAVLAMPQASHSASLAGISFDIEPRLTPDPTDYQQYATLLPLVRAKLDRQNAARDPGLPSLRLSIAGSWGYESERVRCGRAGANITLLECAVANVDVYILMNYRNSAFGCFCRPPWDKPNPPAYKCPASGLPIAGNCTAPNADGMIAKATAAATAVKASSYKPARLSLGVETSCFPKTDRADLKYQYKLSFCGTSSSFLLEQMAETERGLQALGLWDGVADSELPWSVEDFHALRLLEQHGRRG